MAKELQRTGHSILATGRVYGEQLRQVRGQTNDAGKVSRRAADFLVGLRRRVQHRSSAYERFFFQAIKDHALGEGQITADGAAWLRRVLLAGGRIHDEGRKAQRELRGEAAHVSPEFEALCAESREHCPEQRTCG